MSSSLTAFSREVIHTTSDLMVHSNCSSSNRIRSAERNGTPLIEEVDRRTGINTRFTQRRLVELDRNVVLVLEKTDDVLERGVHEVERSLFPHGSKDRLLAAVKRSDGTYGTYGTHGTYGGL